MSKDPDFYNKKIFQLIFLMEKNSKYKIINSEKYKLIYLIKKKLMIKMRVYSL